MPRKAFIERIEKPAKMRRGMDFIETVFKMSRFPVLPKYHPWIKQDKTDMRWLPINQDIQLPENTPLPTALLDRLIEEASHRVVFHECGCRVAFQCKEYPIDVGCLIMGDSALETPSSISREVNVTEAKKHAHRAIEAGVVPVVGKARVDNFIFGVKDRSRMLTVCFCCECCCLTRFARHAPFKLLEPAFPLLDGISIEVGDDCSGCGTCVERCYLQAIEIEDGRAVIGEYCRACGRCATACPNDAIKISIDDPEFLDKAYDRIRAYVKYD